MAIGRDDIMDHRRETTEAGEPLFSEDVSVQEWTSGSLAVTLPKKGTEIVGIESGDDVVVHCHDGRLVIEATDGDE